MSPYGAIRSQYVNSFIMAYWWVQVVERNIIVTHNTINNVYVWSVFDVMTSWHGNTYRITCLWTGVCAALSWWRHQMENFSALLALCTGNSPVTGEFPAQRSVKRNFEISFDLRLSKRLSKQSWGWWPETPSRSLWRHCSVGEMHRSPVFPSQTNSNIELWCCDFFVVGPNKLMRKRSSCRWFDTPWSPYDVTIMRICFVNSPQAIVYGNDIVITADLFNCNSKFVKSPYDIWGCNFCNINHRHLNAQSVLPSTERLGVIS